jgi:uncharacterized protein
MSCLGAQHWALGSVLAGSAAAGRVAAWGAEVGLSCEGTFLGLGSLVRAVVVVGVGVLIWRLVRALSGNRSDLPTGRRGVVTAVQIFPVKGCGAVSVGRGARWAVDRTGLMHDRRWMVVDEEGEFQTQRQIPQLCQLQPTLLRAGARALRAGTVSATEALRLGAVRSSEEAVGGLLLEFPGAPPFVAPVVRGAEGGARVRAQVWSSEVQAVDQGAGVSEWLTAHVLPLAKSSGASDARARRLRLVYMDPALADGGRHVKSEYVEAAAPLATPGEVSFADSMPILITSEASLSQLNRWVQATQAAKDKADKDTAAKDKEKGSLIPMDRFRANIIIGPSISDEGFPVPFEEDEWLLTHVGTATLVGTKLCTRCVVPTTDQRTGEQGGVRAEPYVSLSKYRSRKPGGICFGTVAMPTLHDGACGAVAVGDPLIVLKRGALPPPLQPTPPGTEWHSFDSI